MGSAGLEPCKANIPRMFSTFSHVKRMLSQLSYDPIAYILTQIEVLMGRTFLVD